MLPTIDPDQIISANVVAEPEAAEDVNGNMPLSDLSLICRLVAHLRPRTAFEIGTFRGVTTHNIAKYSDPHAIIYTLDLPPLSSRTMRSPRGVIAWHDYSVWDGVTAALEDLQRSADGFKNLRHVAGTGVAVLLQ